MSSRLEKSRSQRILWLLEELKIDYEIKTYKRQNQLAPEELKEIHPLGKAPIITIESEATEKPLVLAESGFIIEYLIDHFGTWLAPERYQKGKEGEVGGETEEWTRYRYFMHYAEGSIMPLLVIALIFNSRTSTFNPLVRNVLIASSSHQIPVTIFHQTHRTNDDGCRRVQVPQSESQNAL